MRHRYALLLGILSVVLLGSPLSPAEALSPGNSGVVGLWEYPTAQLAEDGHGWVGYADNDPYLTYFVNMAYFPWLEVNLRLTAFSTAPRISEGYGRYKDKALDLKVLLRRGQGFAPSLAVGITDLMGTELLRAKYGVLTWAWDALAFSVGYGTDRLNGIFGGIEWQAAPAWAFKLEYSPLYYPGDKVSGTRVHPAPAASSWNVGVVYDAPWGGEASLSYQRGEDLCFSVAYAYDLAGPFLGSREKILVSSDIPPRISDWNAEDPVLLAEELRCHVEALGGLRDIRVAVGDHTLLVAFENAGYGSAAEACARVLGAVAWRAPWDLRTLSLLPLLRGQPAVRMDIPGSHCALLRLGDLSREDSAALAVRWGTLDDLASEGGTPWRAQAPRQGWPTPTTEFRFRFAYEPRIDRILDNDYEDRFNLDAELRHRTSWGWEFYGSVRMPLKNNIDIWWEPETNDDIRIWQTVLSWGTLRALDDRRAVALLAEAGWLDANWFGANLWGRAYFDGGRWWLGGRASVVQQRDPHSFGGLSEYWRTFDPSGGWVLGGPKNEWTLGAWAQAGYREPTLDVDLMAEYGRFLDEDWGGRVAVTRHWNDVGVGFWMSRTDILTPGKDFTNAGMYLEIPVDAWFGTRSPHVWTQEFTLLSTWADFAGRQPGAWRTPERLWGQLLPDRLPGQMYGLLERFCRAVGQNALPEFSTKAQSLLECFTPASPWREDEEALY